MSQNIPKHDGTKLSGKKKKNLYTKIMSQMEFYFSASNLAKDRFVKNLIDQSTDGYINLKEFTSFNKIKELTEDIHIISDAVTKSKILEISPDGKQIRRCIPIESKDFDACTLYVEKLPQHADLKWIQDVFGRFGKIDYISIPRFRRSQAIKGFAFIEFSNPSSVDQACEFYFAIAEAIAAEKEKAKMEESIAGTSNISSMEGLYFPAASSKKRKRDDPLDSNKRQKKRAKLLEKPKTSEEVQTAADVEVKEANNRCSGEDNPKEKTEDAMDTENKPKKSKRKRRHDNKEKEEEDILKVMPKSEWKIQRNKYLDLQRSTMAHIKKYILLETAAMKLKTLKDDKSLEPIKKASQFHPGVILKVKLVESIQDAVNVKDTIKGSANVAYIDASVGNTEIYVRCHSSEDAETIWRENKFAKLGSSEILKDKEEEEYWKKIENARILKRSTDVICKRRGRDKLAAKAEKLAEYKNKHIFFEE